MTGVVLVSDADNGEPVAMLDARAVTALRTGAAAAVATQELGREDGSSVGLIGCGLHGMWVGRCMADAEFGPGVCFDPDPEAAGAGRRRVRLGGRRPRRGARLRRRLHGHARSRAGDRCGLDQARASTSTCSAPTVPARPRRRSRRSRRVAAEGRLFCDEWQQASHGGELTTAVAQGVIGPDDVTELGAVCAGLAPGRDRPDQITLFDSTGLAIQDLAIVLGALEADRGGTWSKTRQTVEL